MWEPIYSFDNLSYLQRGDFVKITFEPVSQKHFGCHDYDFYFPTYYGKVISSNNKGLNELLVKGKDGKTFYCTDRAGTSGFVTGYFYPWRNQNITFENIEEP